MKKLLIITIALLFSGCLFAQTDDGKYGSEITLEEKTNISDILNSPEEYLDKDVLVEGEVLDVCKMMGCWMELESDVEGEKIKIKVKDGDIIFPVEAKGQTALVEGTVYKIELTQEEAIEYYQHIAEENDKEFDPSTVTGSETLYQIKGLGAEIFDKEG
ncbi:MAG: DUF4920 domain-containing protein [Ignavibacteriaceae bacterium]|nr:DUF4920 domain-containing protein [Ignavibacteriaceae bacterium]